MVARALFGKKSGVYGGWISKPGLDVQSTAPGNFLLDTSTQIFQTITKGTNQIATEGAGSIGAGTVVTITQPLPSGFGAFSNIIAQCVYFITDSNGVTYSEAQASATLLRWSVSGGNISLSIYWRETGGTGTSSLTLYHWAAWSIYRAQF